MSTIDQHIPGNVREYTPPYTYSYDRDESIVDRLRAKVAPIRFGIAARCILSVLRSEGSQINHETTVLEIGSGPGLLSKAVHKRSGCKVVSTDLNQQAFSQGELSHPVVTDALNQPFADGSFHIIMSTDVLEHIADSETALQEIYRLLSDEGLAFLVIADPSEGRFFCVRDHIRRNFVGSDVDYWEVMLKKSGFELIQKPTNLLRKLDWRKIVPKRWKDLPGFACAFNPVMRPGVYIVKKARYF